MLLSLYMRALNDVHLACPIVCAPDKATKSLVESPRALNLEVSRFKFEVGGGMPLLAADWLALLASLLPSLTAHLGPPKISTESLAAMAKISAQETTPGQTFSTADLMLSTTSNPRAEFRFGLAFFSPVNEDVSSSSTDPSQPLTKQSWKNNRSREAPIRASLLIAEVTVDFTVDNKLGHDFE